MNAVASLDCSDDCMRLSGELDFASVVPLQHEGDAWLRDAAPAACRLDMSGVTRCNSAGTALLLAWLRTAVEVGKALQVDHPPDSLIALMQLAGLDKVLKDNTLAATD